MEGDSLGGVRALTLGQPWAYLICAGLKDVENRKRPTSYRGRFLVHAARWCEDDDLLDDLRDEGVDLPESFVQSAIIGYGMLLAVQPSASIWAMEGRSHWRLDPTDAGLFDDPVPHAGQLGFWRPTEEVKESLLAQLTTPGGT